MTTPKLQMTTRGTSRRLLRALAGIGVLGVTAGLVTADLTSAGFTDSTFTASTLRTESPLTVPPVSYDQSAASSLFIDRWGRLHVAGYRGTGDGNGGTPNIKNDPTLVEFGDGVTIVDAAGSTNDFAASSSQYTSYMALDSEGGIWTWGRPYNNVNLIGRGDISTADSYRAGRVTQTAEGSPLPPITAMGRTENQFLALDQTGVLWAWGYGNENLPTPQSAHAKLPTRANTTKYEPNTGQACPTPGNSNAAGDVLWHSLWGGNNSSGAVAQNGLIYSWGYDTSNGLTSTRYDSGCPSLNQGANQLLFEKYPESYLNAAGESMKSEMSAAEKSTRYSEIVANMKDGVLEACSGTKGTSVIDASACPVRQLAFSARAGRVLFQDGELYSWKISTANYGDAFLGRQAGASVYQPGRVELGGAVDYVSAGVSSMTAVMQDGRALGWGENNYCQAIGAATNSGGSLIPGGDCAKDWNDTGNSRRVTLPVEIQGLPTAEDPIKSLSTTQCATWVATESGRLYAWGGGTVAGQDFRYCRQPGSANSGYKIYDYNVATEAQPFGAPVTDRTSGTMLVRGE